VMGPNEWSGKGATATYVNTLPAGESCLLDLDITGAYAVTFQAKDGAGTATVTIRGHAVGET